MLGEEVRNGVYALCLPWGVRLQQQPDLKGRAGQEEQGPIKLGVSAKCQRGGRREKAFFDGVLDEEGL